MKDARRLITQLPGVALKNSAVRVKEVASRAAMVEVAADIKTAFRFRKGVEEGTWVVAEVRTGDQLWEDFDLIARGCQPPAKEKLQADLEWLAREFESRQKRQKEPAESQAADELRTAAGTPLVRGQKKEEPRPGKVVQDEEVRRGAFVAKSFSTLLSSATIEAEVSIVFRFARDERGQWRIVEFRIGDLEWGNYLALWAAVNVEKAARARAELELTSAGLTAFRRERGRYVVAKDHAVLIDQLHPRYLAHIIRLDPWHQPYRYEGTGDGYTLRSDGADGQENTPDDVTVRHQR